VFDELLRQPGVVETVELRSTFGFMAFHGGLEGGTEVIAAAAAEGAAASLYAVVQPPDLSWHVPSSRVSATQSEQLARFFDHVDVVIAVHGYGRAGRANDLLLGGRNRLLAAELARRLRATTAGFAVIDDLDDIPLELRGLHSANPVNQAPHAGVQIELPPGARGSSPDPRQRGRLSRPAPGIVAGLIATAVAWTAAAGPHVASGRDGHPMSKDPPARQ
jgi:phage replication-related protein YjqB (UPF0714/DUF867 family)